MTIWNRYLASLRTSHVKLVSLATLAGALVAGAYLLIAPAWYQATLTVVPATQSKASMGAQLANALGGALDLPVGTADVDVERIAAIFASTSVTDDVIQEFNLGIRYKTRYLEHTRKRLWELCQTRIDRKARLVSLSCEDQDPKFVASMLQFFGERGNDVFRRVSASSATEEVRFLEKRVAEMRKETDEAAQQLRVFEETHKIVDLETQSKAVVSALAALRGQRISKDLELSYQNSFSSPEEPTAVQLRQQLAVLDAKFRTMESAPSSLREGVSSTAARADPSPSDLFPAALSVPKLRFELEQLYRDRKIRETDLMLLMQRLEMAKVNEARDTSAFQVLDNPVVPTFRSRPKRAVTMTFGLILGMLVGLASIYGPRYLRETVAQPLRHKRHHQDTAA
jgi:capsule polysaccharide export protein KpsE/RkpR